MKRALLDSVLQGRWDTGFGPPGPNGDVLAIARLGSDLYVGGEFTQVGNVPARHIARWDGHDWHSLGEGPDNGTSRPVASLLAVGDSLFVGGQFDRAGRLVVNNIAVWRPASGTWGTLGAGLTGGDDAVVGSMLLHGSDLYVGGKFNATSTMIANNIAKWNGQRWDRLGAGVQGSVMAMSIVDNRLYIGGILTVAGSTKVRNAAMWDITTRTWFPLGTGIDSAVYAIAVHGNEVIFGGHFYEAGGKVVKNMAVWNEASREWSAFAVPISNPPFSPGGYDPGFVYSLIVDGDDLYIGGGLRTGVEAIFDFNDSLRGVFRWSFREQKRYMLGESIITHDQTKALIYDMKLVDGILYVGGKFPLAGRYQAANIAAYRLADERWMSFGTSINGANGAVYIKGILQPRERLGVRSIAVSGSDVYLGGCFSSAGGADAENIVKWNGRDWTALGGGVGSAPRSRPEFISPDHVNCVMVSGGDLIVGGRFTTAGGVPVAHVARWNGSAWSPVGDPAGSPFVEVDALAVIRGSLHVLGRSADGAVLARLDGSTLRELGRFDTIASTMALLGDDLYVGGNFTRAGSVPARYLARFNTTTETWSEVDGGADGPVRTLLAHDGKLYVGGEFRRIGGRDASAVAVFDGGSWAPLGSGLGRGGTGVSEGSVRALSVHEGVLYAGGTFGLSSGAPGEYLAAWTGESWLPVDEGTDQAVDAMVPFGGHLLIGGSFTATGSIASYCLAMWTPGIPAAGVIAGRTASAARSGIAAAAPNPSGSAVTFTIRLARASEVELAIYDRLGRPVATVAGGRFDAGLRAVAWDASALPAGAYFCRMISADGISSIPFTVLR